MAWVYLFIAGIFECVWAVGLKYTEGFTKLLPSLMTLAAMVLSVWFLSIALKSIPIGTGYAVWTGIGAIGVAIIGMAFLGEPHQPARMICLLLIISGIIGLKIVT
ncbi:MAG: quaternary ammonium compound-resistance protein SugE [Gammaproteobacteria bacterium]|nr:MAG: quaternary ammonium compound-resistance protein SugE [Gammaproteobacteria bacterium]